MLKITGNHKRKQVLIHYLNHNSGKYHSAIKVDSTHNQSTNHKTWKLIQTKLMNNQSE